MKKTSCPLLELVSLRATQPKSEKIPEKEERNESEKEIKRLKKLNSELYRQLAVKVLEWKELPLQKFLKWSFQNVASQSRASQSGTQQSRKSGAAQPRARTAASERYFSCAGARQHRKVPVRFRQWSDAARQDQRIAKLQAGGKLAQEGLGKTWWFSLRQAG